MTSKGEKGILTLYSDVQATSVRWLWYPFIAVGKITLLQGDPGDGKSTMMMHLIGSYDRQYPYTETKYSDFDKILFSSWKNKPNGKGKDQIPWGVSVD